jgi:hypothetical protein
LSLADALRLRRVQRIDLRSALVLLLLKHLSCQGQHPDNKLQAFEASHFNSLQSQMLPRQENRLLFNSLGGSSRPTL